VRLKHGVSVAGVRPEIVLAMQITASVLQEMGEKLVVTSCLEGRHERNSLHYAGLAFDLRTRTLKVDPSEVTGRLREALGPEYDVVLEPDHIHVEFQPEGPRGVA